MKCLCASTRHAARLLTQYYEKELRPANVTSAQFELLSTLFARPGLSQAGLAEALGLDQTTLSRNLRVLIGRKWIRHGTSALDRRQSLYELTAQGQKAWRHALPYWQRAQAHMQRNLGSEWQMVWSTLEALTNAI